MVSKKRWEEKSIQILVLVEKPDAYEGHLRERKKYLDVATEWV